MRWQRGTQPPVEITTYPSTHCVQVKLSVQAVHSGGHLDAHSPGTEAALKGWRQPLQSKQDEADPVQVLQEG